MFVFSKRKKKLIGYWRTTSETGSSGASIIAYNNITAFKFPDKMQVFLTCNIEVIIWCLRKPLKKYTIFYNY